MTRKAFLGFLVFFMMAVAIHGQQGSIAGKWQTDNVPAALAAQAAGTPAEGGRGGGGGQAIMLDLKVDGNKISGTVTEIGNPPVLNIETGTIDGKMITWVTQPRGVTWNLEFTDDNTLTLTGRIIGGRGGGGGGRGPGAGATAPPPAGGAAAGAPPQGGTPPAATAATPAGGPAGGGGGRGQGGGNRGGGRGGAPIVFHRAK